MYRGKVYNGGDGSESRGNAARSSTNTTENDRLLERFVQLIDVSQIRETVMTPREPSSRYKICLIYGNKDIHDCVQELMPYNSMCINFAIESRIAWHWALQIQEKGSGDPVDSRTGEISSGTSRDVTISRGKNDRSSRSTSLALRGPLSFVISDCAGRKREIHPDLDESDHCIRIDEWRRDKESSASE